MTVRIFYVDESFDSDKFCLSAIGIRHAEWRECFSTVRAHRNQLKQDYGLFLRKEVHAHELVSGRGRLSDKIISKYERSRILFGLLRLTAQLPQVILINICLDVRGRSNPQMDAWDRLINRIERTMLEFERRELPLRRELVAQLPESFGEEPRHKLETRLNSYRPRAIIFADEGREPEITKAIRKMSVFNPVPSRFGRWRSGGASQNIPVQRIVEDPVFKKSHQSFFIQLADCVAFSLLKREVPPTPLVRKYEIGKMFDRTVAGVCYQKAAPRDPHGIVRK
jgi:hypothetical protein